MNKTGPQLLELSPSEGFSIQEKYVAADTLYSQIKEDVRKRAVALDEAISQSTQVRLCARMRRALPQRRLGGWSPGLLIQLQLKLFHCIDSLSVDVLVSEVIFACIQSLPFSACLYISKA